MYKKAVALMKWIILMLWGGIFYVGVEIMFRGYSHWTMFLLGGLCFVLIGSINEFFPWDMPLVSQMFISTIIVTVLEFIFGVVLNICFDLNIWDYSNLPYNLAGQICLLFSVGWFFLSALAIIADDVLRFFFFDEKFPHYTIFYSKK